MLRLGDDALTVLAGHLSATATVRLLQCHSRLRKLLEPIAAVKTLAAHRRDHAALMEFLESYMNHHCIWDCRCQMGRHIDYYSGISGAFWTVDVVDVHAKKPVFGMILSLSLSTTTLPRKSQLSGIWLDDPEWQTRVSLLLKNGLSM
jgi:hypothetical protein